MKHCPLTCMMTAYISLVRSTLEYSSVIWDPYLQKAIDKLEVQRQAVRFISGDYVHLKGSWLCYTDAYRPTSSTTRRQKES